jgi:hypothetical protein
MPRATICVDVHRPDEIEAFHDWLERWESSLTQIYNDGCGCCVDLWNVEGPPAALMAVPERLICQSEWANAFDCH